MNASASRQMAAAAGEKGPLYDLSEWPIVQTTLPNVALSVDAYREHLRQLEQHLHSRGEPCALMLDVRHHPPLNAMQRKLTADFARTNEVRYPGLLKAVALVSLSPVVRGAFTAVAWLISMSYPRKAFATPALAKVWLREQLPRREPAAPARPTPLE